MRPEVKAIKSFFYLGLVFLIVFSFLMCVSINVMAFDEPEGDTMVAPEGFEPQSVEYVEASRVEIFKDFNAWWGENKDESILQYELGLIKGIDYGVRPTTALKDGISPDAEVVIITSNSNGWYSTMANVNDPVSQANLQAFVEAGGVLVMHLADNLYSRSFKAPGIPEQTVNGPNGNDMTLVAPFDHPIVLGPDGLLGTEDDLTNDNIQWRSSCCAHHGILPSLPEDATVFIEDSYGNPLWAEYSLGAGLVIVSDLTLEYGNDENPGVPYGNGFPRRVLLNELYYATHHNQPPFADAGGPYVGYEGSPMVFDAGGSSDPDGDSLIYRWDFDGDGVWDTDWSADPTDSYTFLDDFIGFATVEVSDGLATDTSQAYVTVYNVAPTLDPISVSSDVVATGNSITADANFNDPGLLDTHTAMFEWDDGSASPGTVNESNGSGSASGSHAYDTPGVYAVKLTVTDKDGEEDSVEYLYVVVFDSSDGFVTGGGWIESPEGAYTPNPSLTGKANFGFVSKYKKGLNIPIGQTEFNFKVADLNFHSDSYEWLVVAGPNAIYKGIGQINGEGEYGFMLTAIDGDKNDGEGVDKFRIKIWDKNTEVVIYDNKLGEADNSNTGTELGGGSIVIHN